MTAAWPESPRQCLLGFEPVSQDRDTNQDWSRFLPEEQKEGGGQLAAIKKKVGGGERIVSPAGEAALIYMQGHERPRADSFSNLHVKRWPGWPTLSQLLFSHAALCHRDTHLSFQKVKEKTTAPDNDDLLYAHDYKETVIWYSGVLLVGFSVASIIFFLVSASQSFYHNYLRFVSFRGIPAGFHCSLGEK